MTLAYVGKPYLSCFSPTRAPDKHRSLSNRIPSYHQRLDALRAFLNLIYTINSLLGVSPPPRFVLCAAKVWGSVSRSYCRSYLLQTLPFSL